MAENKFFEKILDNLSRLDEANLKFFLESVENERRMFRRVLDNLDECLIVVNNFRIVFLNNEALRLFSALNAKTPITFDEARKSFSNRNILDFIAATLGDPDYVTEISDTSGQEQKYYLLEKVSNDEDLCIFKLKNITENRKLTLQLKNLESLGALNTLAAGIAHEIKNPLAAIDLHTQILKKSVDRGLFTVPPEVMDYVHIIEEEEKRLSKIVQDFLTAARKRELKPVFEDINTYLEDILHFLAPEIEAEKVHLNFRPGLCPKLFIDRDYLRQAFLNLLKNALEAMREKPDGRVLSIETAADHALDAVRVTISDTGGGIDPEKLNRVFEPYFTTKEFGTGLGLTIVYKIIKEHGGEIRVQSEKGKGSAFTIYLPLRQGVRLLTAESSDS